MTKERRDRLANLAHEMDVDIIEQRDDFKPSRSDDGVLGSPSGESTLALTVNNLGDVVALEFAYNEDFEEHKFCYEVRHTMYVIY
jgi:hypothetical protein